MKKALTVILSLSILLGMVGCNGFESNNESNQPGETAPSEITSLPDNTGLPDVSDAPIKTTGPEPTAAPEPSETSSAKPSSTPTPTPVPTVTPAVTETPTPEPTSTPTPTQTPVPTPVPTPTPVPVVSAEPTPTPVPTPEATNQPTAVPEPSQSPDPTPIPSENPPASPTINPDEEVSMDLSSVNNGVFGISYNFDTNDRLKIYVTKDSQAMWYDIKPQRLTYFPLQLGNGIYKVRVVKEINNTGKYSVVFSKNVALDIPDDRIVYTNSISEIFWTPEMAAIVFAYQRTNNESYEWDMVVSLYDYMVKSYKYDYDKIAVVTGMVPGYVPSIEVVFHDQKLICYDYSVLFAGMLRSLDIPVKLVKGYSTYVQGYHAWNEVYNPDTDKWVVIDITVDSSYYGWGKAYSMEKDPEDYTVKYTY